jgi:N-glycosylase/DNA lyase
MDDEMNSNDQIMEDKMNSNDQMMIAMDLLRSQVLSLSDEADVDLMKTAKSIIEFNLEQMKSLADEFKTNLSDSKDSKTIVNNFSLTNSVYMAKEVLSSSLFISEEPEDVRITKLSKDIIKSILKSVQILSITV